MKTTIIILVALLSISCQSSIKKRSGDGFYTDKLTDNDDIFGVPRIPLIKPLEVVEGQRDKWLLTDNGLGLIGGINGVKEISVINNKFILVHSLNTTVENNPAKEGWFVIIPQTRTLKEFVSHQQYLDLLHKEGFSKEPKLYDVDDVIGYFDDHDTIPW